jgi:penicillin-binding protein A
MDLARDAELCLVDAMDRRSWLGCSASLAASAWVHRADANDSPPTPLSSPESSEPLVLPTGQDATLSRAAQRLLAAARPLAGAAIVARASSGEVLVFEQFKGRTGSAPPLLTPVPAASVFKLVTTTALFERGGVTPRQRVCHAGGEHSIERIHLEPSTDANALCAPFHYALGFSRNSVYAQLVTQYLPRTALLETAERFGFNAPLSFELPTTLGTLELPYNDLAYARAAAGFQGNQLSPIGAAHLALAIARGGEPLRLRVRPDSGSVEPLPRIMSLGSATRLGRMMEVTIHSGTCQKVFSDESGRSHLGNIGIAGKTGTLRADGKDATTSWFLGFAPSRKPEICIAVMLQNPPVWRRKASEVARDLLRCHFAGRAGVRSPFEVVRAPSS